MNRKRKLTWIEKKQIEKMAFDHPFFDIPESVLSKKEAEAIIRSAEARKSGVAIVSEACDKAGVPRPDFVDNHSSVFDNLKEIVAIPAIRRIGIIVIALILLVVFFAATPTGRAIAESVIQYIATLFDDGRLVMNQSDNGTLPISIENADDDNTVELQEDLPSLTYINAFDDFQKATGKVPVILPLPCTELYYFWEPDTDYLVLSATYATDDGTVIALQTWNVDDLISTTSRGFMEYDAGRYIYYSIEEEGQIVINKVFADSVFGINAQGHFILDELIELIKD